MISIVCHGASCDVTIPVPLDGPGGDPDEFTLEDAGWQRPWVEWFCPECSGPEAYESGFEDERIAAYGAEMAEGGRSWE